MSLPSPFCGSTSSGVGALLESKPLGVDASTAAIGGGRGEGTSSSATTWPDTSSNTLPVQNLSLMKEDERTCEGTWIYVRSAAILNAAHYWADLLRKGLSAATVAPHMSKSALQ